ncbi:unnamed protein product [Rotaria sp. Silwood2]|nr:unnamed protein product [Rotaria sp. Silwood2]CAF4452834.1 unnamed protein product [Rotaria sp. Silwood2]
MTNAQIRNRRRERNTISRANHLEQLILEEQNFQSLSFERRDLYELVFAQERPASPKFIAIFRNEQENANKRVTVVMDAQQINCVVCLKYLRTGEDYAQWPCSNNQPHLFHYERMLSSLRIRNTCPLCRHEVEPIQDMPQQNFVQIFERIFF